MPMRWFSMTLLLACRAPTPTPHDAPIEVAVIDAVVDARSGAARAAVLDRVVASAEVVARGGCSSRVMGAKFRGAEMLCIAATSLALAAVAREDAARADTIAPRLDALIERALAPSARTDFGPVKGATLPSSVLYRGLLGLVLVVGSTHRDLMDEVATSLAHDLERGFIASYHDGIWPCDHAPAAAFLRLSRHTAAADTLLERLRAALDGGFPTRVDRSGRIIDGELRTTTLAFTASFLFVAEPPLARAFAEKAIEACDRAPIAACREWRTRHRKGDAASGPLVGEYAVGASALALVASRALDDHGAWHAALARTAELAGGERVATGTLEDALLRWSDVARAL